MKLKFQKIRIERKKEKERIEVRKQKELITTIQSTVINKKKRFHGS